MSKVIDIHTHILPKDLPSFKDRFGYGGFIRLEHKGPCKIHMMRDDGTLFREIEENCWNPETRLAESTHSGVSVQVLSTVPILFSYWAKPKDGAEIARILNDHIASVVESNPKRFIGLGTLPLQDTELSLKEIERLRSLSLHGVEIGTHVNGFNLDDPRFFPIFESLEEKGLSVFVHPWDMLGGDRMTKYWLPWLLGMPTECALAISCMVFGGVFSRFPNLRVAFAHGGGSFGILAGRMRKGLEIRPDLCGKEVESSLYLGKFFVDSLVHDPRALQFLIETFGENRVLLGSDYPFPLGEDRPGACLRGLDPKIQEKISTLNALEWLGIKA